MRDKLTAAVLVTLLTACAVRDPLPPDVRKFVERRQACEHAAGEVPNQSDVTRMKEIQEAVAQYCTGTDAELASLRRRYYANPEVTDKLSVYETQIEAKK